MKRTISFPYEAHFSLSHEPSGLEKELWIVFHGYGQLAEFFLRKFQSFDSPERLFLAPEGTNYGYLKDFQGRVGANWMTKYERETAIENNHRYLDRLLKEILSTFQKAPKIHVLGFSQGAATATRWAARWQHSVQTLVLWAGGFAHDLELDLAKSQFLDTQVILVYGDSDEYLTEESQTKQKEMLQDLGKQAIHLQFHGGHELPTEMIQKIMTFENQG